MMYLGGARGHWSRLPKYLDHGEVLLLAFLTALFFAVYMAYQPTPRGEFPSGWEGWFDQGMYLQSARALAAHFTALGDRDPFLPINLMGFLTFGLCFVRYFKHAMGDGAAFLVFSCTTIIPLVVSSPYAVRFGTVQFSSAWRRLF